MKCITLARIFRGKHHEVSVLLLWPLLLISLSKATLVFDSSVCSSFRSLSAINLLYVLPTYYVDEAYGPVLYFLIFSFLVLLSQRLFLAFVVSVLSTLFFLYIVPWVLLHSRLVCPFFCCIVLVFAWLLCTAFFLRLLYRSISLLVSIYFCCSSSGILESTLALFSVYVPWSCCHSDFFILRKFLLHRYCWLSSQYTSEEQILQKIWHLNSVHPVCTYGNCN